MPDVLAMIPKCVLGSLLWMRAAYVRVQEQFTSVDLCSININIYQ